MRREQRLAMVLSAALAASAAPPAISSALNFTPPVLLGQGQWGAGNFHRLVASATNSVLLGHLTSGWWASADDGASWRHVFNTSSPLSGYGTAAVSGASMLTVDGPRYNVTQGAVTTLTGNRVEQITLLPNGSLTHRSTGRNATWSGMPPVGCRANVPDSPKACPLRTFGADVLLLPDGSWLGAFLAYPATSDPNASEAYSLYAFKSSDAADWRFASVVAERVPDSEEGPSENALTLLANGSVLAVFRTDGGDGKPCAGALPCPGGGGHRMAPYAAAVSNDGGASWLPPRSLPAAVSGGALAVGSVRPRLLTLASGALLLSGGRPSGSVEDAYVWLNRAGDAEIWEAHAVSYSHNALVNATGKATNATPYDLRVWPFDAGVNNSQWPRETTGYTSLLPTAAGGAVVLYAQWLHHHGNAWRTYAMGM